MPVAGITKALKSTLRKAEQMSQFLKIWTPTAVGANRKSPFTDTNICFDHDGTRCVLQINAQTEDATLKKFIQANGTHMKLAIIDIEGQTGMKEEMDAFVKKAVEEATK